MSAEVSVAEQIASAKTPAQRAAAKKRLRKALNQSVRNGKTRTQAIAGFKSQVNRLYNAYEGYCKNEELFESV